MEKTTLERVNIHIKVYKYGHLLCKQKIVLFCKWKITMIQKLNELSFDDNFVIIFQIIIPYKGISCF